MSGKNYTRLSILKEIENPFKPKSVYCHEYANIYNPSILLRSFGDL